MARSRVRTTKPLADELRGLLTQQGVSMRSLAEAIGVDQSYVVRILGAKGAKATRPPSAKVAAAIAEHLGLPRDYFPEYREALVREAVSSDGALRDRIYDSLQSRRRR